MNSLTRSDIELFSTCPASKDWPRESYLDRVKAVSRWCDAAGYDGILVYTDNSLVDPWLVSQLILEETETLCPLVAVQPLYMHPYAAAKMVASLAFLHDRKVFLNMVAGGFRNDLLALNDSTEHDDRYDRLVEYVRIVHGLLSGSGPLSFAGRYYTVKNPTMAPRLPPELMPGVFVSGSSLAGLAAARAIGATAVRYPKPPSEENGRLPDDAARFGMRIGVVARATDDEAWAVALERFAEDRNGQITHKLAMKVSDSRWHGQLSALGLEDARTGASPYWLGPFENYKTFCPYLVGSYDVVGEEIRRYVELGFKTFILDIPPSPEELDHVAVAFDTALAVVTG
jgi:alkanesulfonate monooxygenase